MINKDWDWLRKKCLDCWELNKSKKIQPQWKSYTIKPCKKHSEILKILKPSGKRWDIDN